MDAVTVWNKTLEAGLNLPLVKVDRTIFLNQELGGAGCNRQQILDCLDGVAKTYEVLPPKKLEEIAKSAIDYHLRAVTLMSAAAGIPGGFALIGTIPADVTQYYGNLLCLTQKLLYIYGAPDLLSEDGGVTEQTKSVLTLGIAVAMGDKAARQAVTKVCSLLATQMVKRLPRVALTKYGLYNIIKQVAAFIGIKITKDSFAKSLGKIIPLIGAPINGSISYFTFRKMANNINTSFRQHVLPS